MFLFVCWLNAKKVSVNKTFSSWHLLLIQISCFNGGRHWANIYHIFEPPKISYWNRIHHDTEEELRNWSAREPPAASGLVPSKFLATPRGSSWLTRSGLWVCCRLLVLHNHETIIVKGDNIEQKKSIKWNSKRYLVEMRESFPLKTIMMIMTMTKTTMMMMMRENASEDQVPACRGFGGNWLEPNLHNSPS